jgi:hypothetical protein
MIFAVLAEAAEHEPPPGPANPATSAVGSPYDGSDGSTQTQSNDRRAKTHYLARHAVTDHRYPATPSVNPATTTPAQHNL